MSLWNSHKLKELCSKIGSGATPRGGKETYRTDGIALIRSQNVLDFNFSVDGIAFISDEQANQLSNVEVKENDVLLNITGDSVARVCQVPNAILPARVNQHVAIVRTNPDRLLPELLKYYLLNPSFKSFMLGRASAGATRNALTKGMIEEFEITVPERIKEQKAIAKILSSLDDKIELNRRMNATLEAMARALFKAWFVDFEPVLANKENRPSTSASPEIAKLFPSEIENAIPKGWQVGTVGENFNLTMGRSPSGDTYNKDGEGEVFYQGRTDFGFRFPTPRVYCTQPSTFAEKNDTLLSVRAPVGDVNIAPSRCCIGRGIASIRHKSGSRSFTYYNLWNLASHFDNFESEGTVFGSITKVGLQATKVVEPTNHIDEKFEEIVGKLDDLIETNSSEIITLSEIRDSLLPRLISGKIRVG